MHDIKVFLDSKLAFYNTPAFIKNDPIAIPHRFSKKQDIEIAGFFAALFAWGHRTIIINKATELMQLMHNEPYAFVKQFTEKDLKPMLSFKHRTFNYIDIMYLLEWLQQHYRQYDSLEYAFYNGMHDNDIKIENGLIYFYNNVFSLPHAPKRTQKHISTPAKKSACKRMNMYLRWMVRNDTMGVDFGIWQRIQARQLVCPLDVHVTRVAKRFGLIDTIDTNWKQALTLTNNLKKYDANDPVKYDFALFALGVEEKYS
jgi:uncharacterized protein (TIGR02757 family)